jgi:diguanylate cyclase (GGDEF)-like protein
LAGTSGVWVSSIHDSTDTSRPIARLSRLSELTTALETQASSSHTPLFSLPRQSSSAALVSKEEFFGRLESVRNQMKPSDGTRFVVLMLDLDRFKFVTASLGRAAGDQLLEAVVLRISERLSERDTVARIGGDEFAVLLEEPWYSGTAMDAAEVIQRTLIHGFPMGGSIVYATASIGIAPFSSSYQRGEDVLRDAEIAMYDAKASGGARAQIFHHAMRAKALALFELESDLRRAVERGEFELHYQPIVSTVTGRVRAFEALLRWCHPIRGILPPASFLNLLRDTGLILPVGEWVINAACEQAKKWQDLRGRPIPVSINLAPQQFLHMNVVSTVLQAIDRTGLDPSGLVVEITEDALLHDIDGAKETLGPLRDRGVRIMIDDFGTGYSSLNYLRKLPIDAIKIDASFVDRIERFAEDRMIVSAVVALAHALELRVIAEGVERREQLIELIALDCEEVQGFLVSQPVTALDATRMIRDRWVFGTR